jgi:hypothetical protein
MQGKIRKKSNHSHADDFRFRREKFTEEKEKSIRRLSINVDTLCWEGKTTSALSLAVEILTKFNLHPL